MSVVGCKIVARYALEGLGRAAAVAAAAAAGHVVMVGAVSKMAVSGA